MAVSHLSVHIHRNRHLFGIQGGHLEGDGGQGRLLQTDAALIPEIPRYNDVPGPGIGEGSDSGHVGQIHLNDEIVFIQTADDRTGAAELHVHGGILALGEHQASGGQRVLRADELHRYAGQFLGGGTAEPIVHIQPKYNRQQQRKR